MSPQVISRSLGLYQQHGAIGLSSRGRRWTTEEKLQILKYMNENHLSCKETSIQFGISGSCTVWEWERRYLEEGMSGLENKKKGRKPRTPKPKPPKTRLEELEEENLNLRIENEYQKKLNALVAEREKRESGNR
jgi:transposase